MSKRTEIEAGIMLAAGAVVVIWGIPMIAARLWGLI